MVGELESVVGRGHLLVEPGVRSGFEQDITGRFGAPAAAVVRPADTEQVARLLSICSRHRIAVVPQGGNTGLVGG
ncbi:MAG TPA: FAD-binding protein, partial [Solirubrobacterales bacterium]|nr:FAD-binding protein [Solirubrobacterales bacterium]